MTNQQGYKAFQVITGVSIASDQPVDWGAPDQDSVEGMNFTSVAPNFSWVQVIVTPLQLHNTTVSSFGLWWIQCLLDDYTSATDSAFETVLQPIATRYAVWCKHLVPAL